MKRLSMKDIAVAAGVSRPTVSRALKGDAQISEETTERIRRLAETMGYRRDPAYEVLARLRWGEGERFLNTVGFLLHPDYPQGGYLTGARDCAYRLGYAVDAFDLTEFSSAGALQNVIDARGIRGLILPTFTQKYPVPALDWSRYALVACSVDAIYLPVHMVRTNVVRKVEMAWERCRERGYGRIGFVLPHSGPHELDVRRLAIARECVAGLPRGERIPVWCGSFAELGKLSAWLERNDPDAVIAGQPSVLPHLDAYGQRAGRFLPHCCLLEAEGRACVSSRTERIGYVALSILHQQLMENTSGIPEDPFTVVIEPKWTEGPTLPARPARFS